MQEPGAWLTSVCRMAIEHVWKNKEVENGNLRKANEQVVEVNEHLRKDNQRLQREVEFEKKELGLAKSELMKKETLLQERTKRLCVIVKDIEKMRQISEESVRRIEMQENDLREQSTTVCELYMTLKLKTNATLCLKDFLQGAMRMSKALIIFRKHQRNLIAVTKPCIEKIITSASEAGIVSKNIKKCANNCSIPNHDCTDMFYKALLVSVGDSPRVLEIFLRVVVQELDSEPCRRLCSQILDELNVVV